MSDKKVRVDKDMVDNLMTLERAFANKDVGLVVSKRRSDGKSVILLVTVFCDSDTGTFELTPFAEMILENPFEMYVSPEATDAEGPNVFMLEPGRSSGLNDGKAKVLRITEEDGAPSIVIEAKKGTVH